MNIAVNLAPPKGFRPAIPMSVKGDVLIRQEGKCWRCKQSLGEWKNTQFDHTPALQLRLWCAETGSTVPAANDPEHIEALHVDCHKAKSSGRKGESKLSISRGDQQEIAKTRRLERTRIEAAQKRLLAPSEDREPVKRKVKAKIPSRPFQRKPKDGSKTSRRQKGTQRSGR